MTLHDAILITEIVSTLPKGLRPLYQYERIAAWEIFTDFTPGV